MKLSSVFAHYLYQNKTLNLPGVGTFEIDPAASIPDPSDKNSTDFMHLIKFTKRSILRADDELIEFIRVHTGKIKPLAESDLESYLSDGKLLLNIGKPFFLEGIGTLQKLRDGDYEYAPGAPVLERLDAEKPGDKILKQRPAFDSGYSQIEPENNSGRRILIGLGLALGLGAVIWGGYSLYNRNTQPITPAAIEDKQTPPPATQPAPVKEEDSAALKKIDSLNTAGATQQPVLSTPASSTTAGSFRYVLETTANKARALRRIAQLELINPRIKMETTDSTSFRIFVELPGTPADTLRTRDSLNLWYYGKKDVKVSVEQ
ncbi:MAG: hypothetical protein EOO02_15160 [Chitinophagaceae bacterium]|nr:MAG: hypothetical protein EOO02_15160 [Chitinophagaceae bacterium]